MRPFSTLLALCGVFLVTGCQKEQPIEGSAGSSTPVVNIDDSQMDCCVQPEEDRPEEPEPIAPSDSEPTLEIAAESETSSE